MGSSAGKLKVSLTADSGLYKPGQVISGKLHVINSKPYEHRGITVKCEGFVEDSSGAGARAKGVNRTKYHLRIEKSISIEGILPVGHHTFPVVFALPKILPSSSYKIIHKLSAHISGTSKKDSYDASLIFKVHGNVSWSKSLLLENKS